VADDEAFLHDVYDLLHIFGDKWTIPVMVALSDGPLRPSEILSRVNGYRVDENWPDRHGFLHDSILARSLARMTAIGLLKRTSIEPFPPKVIYSLESPAEEFLELLQGAFSWPRANTGVVTRAQVFQLARRNAGELPEPAEPFPGDSRARGAPTSAGRKGPGRDGARRGSAGPTSPQSGRARAVGRPGGPR
jgi:DNA-binding HxlR family transcriptional regulator